MREELHDGSGKGEAAEPGAVTGRAEGEEFQSDIGDSGR